MEKRSAKMPEEKLARLRELADRNPAGHLDVQSRDHITQRLGQRTKAYAGIPTFLDVPLARDYRDLDVALVGVPHDLGVTNRPGARFGPRAVRQIERTGGYHHVSRIMPEALIRVADVGDVPIDHQFDPRGAAEDIEAWYHGVVDAGVIPLSVGGDHSITYPILRALGRDEPVGLVHIDAHCDTGPAWSHSKFHHGGPFLNAAVDGVLDPERTIQIGIRGGSEAVWSFSYASGMTVVHVEEIESRGVESIIQLAREVVGDGPTYVSFDVDALDPVYAPGTGTPEVGGLTPLQAQALIRGLDGLNLVGADVVEVAPQYDPTTNTAMVAANMLFEELCVITQSLVKRR